MKNFHFAKKLTQSLLLYNSNPSPCGYSPTPPGLPKREEKRGDICSILYIVRILTGTPFVCQALFPLSKLPFIDKKKASKRRILFKKALTLDGQKI
jgi:hypothetical protein